MTNNIFTQEARNRLGSGPIEAGGRLLTFEELDQNSGFVLYETTLPTKFTRDPSNLVIEKLRDRALIYVDGKFTGVLSRENNIKSLPISAKFGNKLQIFVENQGRINFQENFDRKGIIGNVTFQSFDFPYFEELSDWTITGYPFDDYAKVENFIDTVDFNPKSFKNGWLREGPVVFYGELNLEGIELADTWWNTSGSY